MLKFSKIGGLSEKINDTAIRDVPNMDFKLLGQMRIFHFQGC